MGGEVEWVGEAGYSDDYGQIIGDIDMKAWVAYCIDGVWNSSINLI